MTIVPALSCELFAASLFRSATPDGDNFVLSPRSITDTLGLLSLGACGETFESILQALFFKDVGEMVRALSETDKALREVRRSGVRCEIDTALWIKEGLPLRAEFRKAAHQFGGTGISTIAMDETGRRIINEHVSRVTRGMIPELLLLPPEGELVATNAVWFKGMWLSSFEPKHTREGVFHTPGEKVRVPFMHQTDRFVFFEGDDFEAIRLPYGYGDFVLDIFLPRIGVPLAKIECFLEDMLAQTRAGFLSNGESLVALALPKFDIHVSLDICEALRRLGAGRIFSQELADFSNIVDSEEPFCVSSILHQARICLDEYGTEAAAATAMGMALGLPEAHPPRPRSFRVNRPFLFALRLSETSDILFCGRIVNPVL